MDTREDPYATPINMTDSQPSPGNSGSMNYSDILNDMDNSRNAQQPQPTNERRVEFQGDFNPPPKAQIQQAPPQHYHESMTQQYNPQIPPQYEKENTSDKFEGFNPFSSKDIQHEFMSILAAALILHSDIVKKNLEIALPMLFSEQSGIIRTIFQALMIGILFIFIRKGTKQFI